LTMSFHAEARIAGELLKFAASGQLYRGSKPVMWSVVERTALAEAEIEYHDYESDTIWVKFPVADDAAHDAAVETIRHDVAALDGETISVEDLETYVSRQSLSDSSVVIWTTTPWTIPGNRAVAFSPRVEYGLYEV